MTVDYSQSGEQEVLLDLAGELPTGRFLDIGAGDGETLSNTRALALKGWAGVAVEPAAWAFDKLVDLYADTLVQPVCAVVLPTAPASGLVTMQYSKDDHLSSVDERHVDRWSAIVPFKEVTAACVSMRQLLDHFMGGFSVVTIDAEGVTSELVRAYSRHPSWGDVKVVCFERDGFGRRQNLHHWDNGWQLVASTPNNAIFAR